MMKRFIQDADRIFHACGTTDFRKQISGLVAMVQMQFKFQQVEWLLQGLKIEQKKAHYEVKISSKNSCF